MAILSIGELLGMGPDQLSGFVPYSAISGSDNVISSINGSGLSGAGTDTTAVSAIASAYAESAASGKLDESASSLWYPLTGNPSGFLTSVDLSNYATTGYVDSSVSSKVDQSAFDNCCSSVNSAISSISGALSGKLDNSASSSFYPSDNPSGFISSVDLSDYATTAYVDSSVSSKADQSALSSYVAKSAVATDGDGYVTAIEGSSIKAGGSIISSYLHVDSGLELTLSGDSAVLRTSGVEPKITYGEQAGLVTSLNGKPLPRTQIVSQWLPGNMMDTNVGGFDVIYKPSTYYTDCGSGSASATATAVASARDSYRVYWVDPANATLTIPSPANAYSALSETAYAQYYFTADAGVTAYSGLAQSNFLSVVTQTGLYNAGDPISTYTGDNFKRVIFFRSGLNRPADPTTFVATAYDTKSAKFVQTAVQSACIVKQPTGWISSDASSMDVGPTSYYDGYVHSASSYSASYASGGTSMIPLELSSCSGDSPFHVSIAVTLGSLPTDMRWDLVQSSDYNIILDSTTTTGSTGEVRLDAVTYGRANGEVCNKVYLKGTTFSMFPNSGNISVYLKKFQAVAIPTGTVLG